MLILDHIFILVSPSAPEADALVELGLAEGPTNAHSGQGTANRRFFFANTTLECLYINDIAEAMNGTGKDLQLVERAIDIDASPFGLVTRWKDEKVLPGFPTWKYQPDYFPKPLHFYVGKNSSNFAEPLCICMPPALQKPAQPPSPNNMDWILTAAEVRLPNLAPSKVLETFASCELISIEHNQDHHLTLEFNNAQHGQKHVMPELQLTITC